MQVTREYIGPTVTLSPEFKETDPYSEQEHVLKTWRPKASNRQKSYRLMNTYVGTVWVDDGRHGGIWGGSGGLWFSWTT